MFTVLCFFAHLGNRWQFNLGADGSRLVDPHSDIVANFRGKQLRLCSGNSVHPKECYPYAAWDFKVGDVIDYTWGMSKGQGGELVFAIVPSGY